MRYSCGIDFGTSNSVVAIVREGDRRAEVVIEEPSCLLVVDDGGRQAQYVGREAIARYRGSAEKTRFVKSMKSILSDPGFQQTRIHGRSYGPAQLARPLLVHLKETAERRIGQPVDRIVLGRPVHFSERHENDAMAEGRLLEAAALAGFTDVRLQLEPIAAGWSYASSIDRESLVLVADIGGGTADFSVLRFRPDGSHEVLSTGGVRAGGDDFDSRIMWNRLVPFFGYGSRFESWGKLLDVPVHVFVSLCRWDRIPFLKESKTWTSLQYIRSGSTDKPAIGRLMTLIEKDLGFAVFRAIAEAKHMLSGEMEAMISLPENTLRIAERLTRGDFEGMIEDDVERMVRSALDTLSDAGVDGMDVDACFLTGGCSLVPSVLRRFTSLVQPGRLSTRGDTFTSVASGLALYGMDSGITTEK